jgi:hypothetical protein
MSKAIKMRVNVDKNSTCSGCGTKWKNTKEMYDLMICGKMFTLCYDCVDEIFHKTLSAYCRYNAKVKSQEDIQRIQNYKTIKGIKNA